MHIIVARKGLTGSRHVTIKVEKKMRRPISQLYLPILPSYPFEGLVLQSFEDAFSQSSTSGMFRLVSLHPT